MKDIIVAKDKEHLKSLIKNEIENNGNRCDLNHIDISRVIDMSYLFYGASFDGNISQWDTSKVINMEGMFLICTFNGDVSQWDVSNVKNMRKMFNFSYFRGDISDWKPLNLEICEAMFGAQSLEPYWAKYENRDERNIAIEKYHLPKELDKNLPTNDTTQKKMKI